MKRQQNQLIKYVFNSLISYAFPYHNIYIPNFTIIMLVRVWKTVQPSSKLFTANLDLPHISQTKFFWHPVLSFEASSRIEVLSQNESPHKLRLSLKLRLNPKMRLTHKLMLHTDKGRKPHSLLGYSFTFIFALEAVCNGI